MASENYKVIPFDGKVGRWIIVDDCGKVLDDAQGYGYTSPQKAHAAWGYKHRSSEKVKKDRLAKAWFRKHDKFIDRVAEYVFIDLKEGIETPNSVLIELLKGENFDDLPFSPEEFPKYFRKKW